MAKCVAVHWLVESGPTDCFFDGSLEHRFIQMVSAVFAAPMVLVDAGCGKDPLPAQFPGRVWILLSEGFRHLYVTCADCKISFMLGPHAFQMTAQRWADHSGPQRNPILISFGRPDHDLIGSEIHIFDSELKTL